MFYWNHQRFAHVLANDDHVSNTTNYHLITLSSRRTMCLMASNFVRGKVYDASCFGVCCLHNRTLPHHSIDMVWKFADGKKIRFAIYHS